MPETQVARLEQFSGIQKRAMPFIETLGAKRCDLLQQLTADDVPRTRLEAVVDGGRSLLSILRIEHQATQDVEPAPYAVGIYVVHQVSANLRNGGGAGGNARLAMR